MCMKKLGRLGLVLGVLTLGTTACEDPPTPAMIHRVKASEHMVKKEFKQAAAEYELSLKDDPKQEKVWEKKAFAHMQVGETDKALESLQKLLEFRTDPTARAEVYSSMASLYMTSGRAEQAEQTFTEVLKINPKDESALGWLAEIYAQRGGARSMAAPLVDEHLQKALGYYDQVIAINPNSANTYLNKRVVMAKYMEHERVQQQVANLEMIENAKKPAMVAEAKAKLEASAARMEEFKTKINELNQKFAEAQKALKAQQAAPPAPAPAPAK
jgi:tetratricopeptide (TPR) repeat protein